MSDCVVRYAERSELERVNELRAMVNELHVEGRPDIFRPGFTDELQRYIYQKFDSENSDVIAALINGTICGFAMVEYIDRPASPYRSALSSLTSWASTLPIAAEESQAHSWLSVGRKPKERALSGSNSICGNSTKPH